MENKIIVEKPQISGNTIKYHYEITGPWQEAFTDMRAFELQYSTDVTMVPEAVAILPFLANVMPVAWVYDAVVEAEECDSDFYDSLDGIKKGYADMYPMLDWKGSLQVKNVKLCNNRAKEGSIAFFSGGVDSYDTLIRHKDEKPVLMSIWGADIATDDEVGFKQVENLLKQTAEEYHADWITVKSGFRDFLNYDVLGAKIQISKDNWWHGFQHGIGIITHSAPIAYLQQKKMIYLAASLTLADKGIVTCASDPTIDNAMQFCGCNVWHDGYDVTRQQKIQKLVSYAKEEKRNITLRVCWEAPGGKNCCQCEKCFRTMLGIYAEGGSPQNYGFDCSVDKLGSLSKQVRRGKEIKIDSVYYPMYKEIRDRMREKYAKEEITKSLRWFYDFKPEKTYNRALVNVACSVITLVLNLVISFFLSPFIVEKIGVEANGFVMLANSFVMYAQIIVAALNSMAARYITMSYVQKDYKKAQIYYNSVFWGNLIIVAVLILPASLFIVFMELFLQIPPDLVMDVKILFSFVFFNFFIGTAMPNWDCGTYATNRLDRMYIPEMIATVFRSIFLLIVFMIFVPKVWYIGLAASLVCLICLGANAYNTHKLTPELGIVLKPGKIICSKAAIRELVGSGIWNSVSNAGVMMLDGLDLLLCNLLLGPTVMGIATLAKVLGEYVGQLSMAVRNALAPGLTIHYGKGDMDTMMTELKRAMKITSVFVTIPVAGIIVLGGRFFALWVPSQDAQLLHMLACISIGGYIFTGGIQILYTVFPTVNKVKENALALLISGVISVILTILLLCFTDLGIWAIMLVSEIVCLLRNMLFTVPATAKYLGVPAKHFYARVGLTVVSTIVLVAAGLAVTFYIPQNGWGSFVLAVLVMGIASLVIQGMFILNKQERRYIIQAIMRRINAVRK